MTRGGARQGAGKKSSWKSGCKFEQTKLIRVPAAISTQLLEIAHWLDEGFQIKKLTKPIQCELSNVLDTVSPNEALPRLFNETEFAKEININRSTLKNRKKRFLNGLESELSFYAYLSEHDPQSRQWRYCRDTKKYYFE